MEPTPTKTRSLSLLLLLIAVTVTAAIVGGTSSTTPADAATTPSSRVRWIGQDWFLAGANVPYVSWRCDFGCGLGGGVRQHRNSIDRKFQQLSDKGVKVVRWYAFPDDAWQINRGAGNAPTSLRASRVYADMDVAVRIAEQNDLYLDLVLFSDTRTIPTTWMTDPAQREALADAVGPMFARYRSNPHVMGWEIFNEPELGIDDLTVPAADVQATVQRLTQEVHARSNALASVGGVAVDRIDLWNGLGLDFHAPHWFTPQVGAACALCTTVSSLAASEGADAPVVIGAMDDGGSSAAARSRLSSARSRGYAGAWTWSLYKRTAASQPGVNRGIPFDAHWRAMYAKPNSTGPREGLLNPCIGPEKGSLRCPNLRMSKPDSLSLGRLGGRTVLFSRNSINSVGRGPAELHGRRHSRFTMRASQRIHRVGGGRLGLRTNATLLFKAIPGQYRYWKWKNAATMELWRLDGAGNPVSLVRRGPKTVYCLRDLKRTRGYLRRSPSSMQYPGCSQNANQRERTLGTSVGWSDVYPATYHENWVPVGGLRGCFAYVHIVDPTNVILESSEHDNRASVVVRLPYTGSNRGCPGAKPIPGGTPGGGGY